MGQALAAIVLIVFAVVLALLRAAGRVSPRRARYFSLLRQRKVPKRKATHCLRPLRCAKGHTCVGALAGCAVELTALLRSSVRTTPASQMTKHARFDAHAHPANAPPQAQPEGGEKNTGHRCARPRGAQALRATHARPSAAMARNLPSPSARAEKRRARGGRVPQDTRLCGLTCCGCPNGAPQARSEFRSTPRERASQVAPARSVGVTGSRVALSLLTFFRRSERK